MSNTGESLGVFQPDVIVVGAGLIGLACATEVAREGLRVLVVSSSETGAASAASAGILSPSVGHSPPPALSLGIAARNMYPEYVGALSSRTGVDVPLDLSGVVEVVSDEWEASAARARLSHGSSWLDTSALHDLEPALAPAAGGALHHGDGSVDAVALLRAVGLDASRNSRVLLTAGRAVRIHPGPDGIAVELEGGRRFEAPTVVLAAGAWVGSISGVPRPLPVVPVRGQMLAFDGAPTRHVVMGPQGYLVPRGNRSLIGSTMEHTGFDAAPTREGAAVLRRIAADMCPTLAARALLEQWAGLRPVTPDLLPIIGEDPACEGLLYACGHSKNGVLLAPLTARAIADLIARGETSVDLTPYRPGRFPTPGR